MIDKQTTDKMTDTKISYWDGTAKYDKELSRLTKEHMPDSGEADTVEGELIRICNRLIYEYCNNGNCNVMDIEWGEEEIFMGYDDDDEEEYEYEEVIESVEIGEFYVNMLELIKETIPSLEPAVNDLEIWLEDCALTELQCQFNQKEHDRYTVIVDGIMEYVLPREGNFVPFKGY